MVDLFLVIWKNDTMKPQTMSLAYPIDLVYLWVDGSDPQWVMRKNQYLIQEGATEQALATPERWQDNNELLYSLRSVDKFVPWINHIYIVTDNQCPPWLNRHHPKITIVDHKDFIPPEFLPLFSSSSIESFLPYIPNLSEHFLFANDDMFFGRNVKPSHFFDCHGNPIVIVKPLYDKPVGQNEELCAKLLCDKGNASRVRSNILIYKKYHRPLNLQAGHVIDPCRKSYMLEALNDPDFAEAIETTRRLRFRSPMSIQRILFPLNDFCKGRTTLKDVRHLRELKRLFVPYKMPLFLSKESDLSKALKIRPELFCYFPGDYNDSLQLFFQKYFPEKSSFEV